MRLLSLLALAGLGCGVQELAILDGPSADGGPAIDAGARDAGRDAGAVDAAMPDEGFGRRVAAGRAHSCALRDDGIWCWGGDGAGQLGLSPSGDRTRPERVELPPRAWRSVLAGAAHTCARDAAGAVWCWGRNDLGQLGQGDFEPRSGPVEVALPAPVAQLGVGENHACAILTNGQLHCWGHNYEGQLGLDDLFGAGDVPEPTRVGTESDWEQVDGHQGHSCGVRMQGTLHCWGRNTESQLGLGPSGPIQRRFPTPVPDARWLAASPGQSHSCGIDAAGALHCWGSNGSFQLGTGDREPRDVPTRTFEGPVVQLDTDTFHGCAVTPDEAMRCWGRNVEGQLGTGDLMDLRAPTEVGASVAWSEVATGRFHTCARSTDGRFFCTGENSEGRLGTGDTERRRDWTEVAFPDPR
ncbi:MAG TPA: hypothetical protein RMG45_14320 [Polyangiaceae bacterium LLY-WYZ-15_(1-7)]|nr:hypothetical protein [Polyangiaceae bacterium LLY-WYZ-15_(1-7)]HJL47021.1 hypothetical protein [Polyangiaceae bacterium LLY-WYZ-15_(1-7)]